MGLPEGGTGDDRFQLAIYERLTGKDTYSEFLPTLNEGADRENWPGAAHLVSIMAQMDDNIARQVVEGQAAHLMPGGFFLIFIRNLLLI